MSEYVVDDEFFERYAISFAEKAAPIMESEINRLVKSRTDEILGFTNIIALCSFALGICFTMLLHGAVV